MNEEEEKARKILRDIDRTLEEDYGSRRRPYVPHDDIIKMAEREITLEDIERKMAERQAIELGRVFEKEGDTVIKDRLTGERIVIKNSYPKGRARMKIIYKLAKNDYCVLELAKEFDIEIPQECLREAAELYSVSVCNDDSKMLCHAQWAYKKLGEEAKADALEERIKAAREAGK